MVNNENNFFHCKTKIIGNTPVIDKNIFPCLFSVHNTILSRHEKVCLMRLHFEKYFSHHWAK